MAIEGVDYAGDHPDPAGLYAAGKRFVVRYGGPGGDWKHLTASEARALDAAGLALVANAEGTASGLLSGWSAGADWARQADQHFRGLGMPTGRPIYLSVDFDVTSGQWPAVAEALRGAASVLGAARVGVYGSYDVMQWARRDGVARWFWQTYAWSGGRWAGHNTIEQYRNGVRLADGTVDLCRALTADYGQWGQPTEEDDMYEGEDRQWDRTGWRRVLDFLQGDATFSSTDPDEAVAGKDIVPVKLLRQAVADVSVVKSQLAALAARPPATVDVEQLAAAIVAKLPPTTLTPDQVEAAVKDALREGTGG